MNILLALQQLLALVEKGTRPLARAHRLTPEDLLVLAWLRANGAMELSQLARSCGRSRQNLHRTLLRLERAELALAMRPDRELMNTRIDRWAITDKGYHRFVEVERDLIALERRLFSTGDNAEDVLRFLNRVAAEVARATAPPCHREAHTSHFSRLLDDRLPPVARERTT